MLARQKRSFPAQRSSRRPQRCASTRGFLVKTCWVNNNSGPRFSSSTKTHRRVLRRVNTFLEDDLGEPAVNTVTELRAACVAHHVHTSTHALPLGAAGLAGLAISVALLAVPSAPWPLVLAITVAIVLLYVVFGASITEAGARVAGKAVVDLRRTQIPPAGASTPPHASAVSGMIVLAGVASLVATAGVARASTRRRRHRRGRPIRT